MNEWTCWSPSLWWTWLDLKMYTRSPYSTCSWRCIRGHLTAHVHEDVHEVTLQHMFMKTVHVSLDSVLLYASKHMQKNKHNWKCAICSMNKQGCILFILNQIKPSLNNTFVNRTCHKWRVTIIVSNFTIFLPKTEVNLISQIPEMILLEELELVFQTTTVVVQQNARLISWTSYWLGGGLI